MTEHLRRISPLGTRAMLERRKAGLIEVSDETRRKESRSLRKRFQKPEEQRKLERARQLSFRVIGLQERAKMMHEAFLARYGSFVELAKMGLRAPRRKPNKPELEVAKMLGTNGGMSGRGTL